MAYSFNVSCDKDLHERFSDHCYKSKLKVSTEIRKFMEMKMKEDENKLLILSDSLGDLHKGHERLKRLVNVLIEKTGQTIDPSEVEIKEGGDSF